MTKILGILFLLFGAFVSSYSQAIPTATRGVSIQLGLGFSNVSPDYYSSHIEGYTVYGDLDFLRHFGVEGEIRDATIVTPTDIGEKNYLFGPRAIYRFGRFTPYIKVIGGIGTFVYQKGIYKADSSRHQRIIAFGGGLDYLLSEHISIRAIDVEFQDWPRFYNPKDMTPLALTFGAAYRF
jgi:hypothetical protein